ncbi:MAG: sirohydrochlorin cobaltochelatase [Clostridia bacterium]
MKSMKPVLSTALALLFAVFLLGCSSKHTVTDPMTKPIVTGTAEPTDPIQLVKPVLLAVSFGTSYNDSRDITIGAIETALQTAYPYYEVRRAFTSQIIIDKLAERDGLKIDNVKAAMDRLIVEGVKEVVIQPTHIMNGFEYDDVVKEVTPYADKFDSFKIGKPLLTTDDDYSKVISIIVEETKSYNGEGTAIVFMGHGTEHAANTIYAKLQKMITEAGFKNYFIGTVEATPSIDDVIKLVKAGKATKVILTPFMIVAGDHANNDMAGDAPDSWKTKFEAAGLKVECLIKGLGEYIGIQQVIVAHAASAMAK